MLITPLNFAVNTKRTRERQLQRVLLLRGMKFLQLLPRVWF